MAWITIPGLTGKVYVPDSAGQPQKKASLQNLLFLPVVR